jgi:hypothetical protein
MKTKVTNVIPFDKAKKKADKFGELKKIKRQLYGSTEPASKAKGQPQLINLDERREEKKAAEKRTVTRTVLSQFLGVFVILPNKGLQPVALYDVSEAGLSFDIPNEVGSYNIAETVTMRIYLSHDMYFSFHVKISNKRMPEGDGISRHGAVFKKDDESFKTLFYFTKFLENVSLVARRDSGDRLLGRID